MNFAFLMYIFIIYLSVCTCANGECNNGPSGDGHCQPDTCEIGFVGEDCDLEISKQLLH